MTLPNSVRIYDPPANYAQPNPNLVHEVVIENLSDVVATDVSVSLSVREPMVLVIVAVDPQLHPRGHWQITTDNERYQNVTVKLNRIKSDGRARIRFAYSYPTTIAKPQEFTGALKIAAWSPSQKSSVEGVYLLVPKTAGALVHD
ncbi:MAG: hypothetical protein ACE5G5_06915 [Candidatus Methylomirabilales bacterium]